MLSKMDDYPVHQTSEPMIRFQMLAIGYQHPEWGHGLWKGAEVLDGAP